MSEVRFLNEAPSPNNSAASIASSPPSITYVLLWKQFRESAPVVVVVIAVMAILIVAKNATTISPAFWQAIPGFLTCCAIGVAAALALIAFTGEEEAGTKNYLATLPVGSQKIARTKILGCILCLFIFLLIRSVLREIIFFGVENSYPPTLSKPMRLGTFIGTWNFAFFTLSVSIVCTCWFKSTWAAITAIIAVSLSLIAALQFISWSILNIGRWWGFSSFELLLIAVTCVLFGVSWSTAGSWLRPREPFYQSLLSNDNREIEGFESDRSTVFLTLLWQAFHQQWIVVVAVLLSFLVGLCFTFKTIHDFDFFFRYWCAAVGCLLGFAALFGDKKNDRYLFFHQQREFNFLFWCSRLAMPLGVLLVVGILAFAVKSWSLASTIGLWVGLTCFATTFLASLLIRTSVFVLLIGMVSAQLVLVSGFILNSQQTQAWLNNYTALTGKPDIPSVLTAFLFPITMLGLSLFVCKYWLSKRERWFSVRFSSVAIIGLAIFTTCQSVRSLRMASARDWVQTEMRASIPNNSNHSRPTVGKPNLEFNNADSNLGNQHQPESPKLNHLFHEKRGELLQPKDLENKSDDPPPDSLRKGLQATDNEGTEEE